MPIAHYEHDNRIHDIEYDEANIKDCCVACGAPIQDELIGRTKRYEHMGNYCKWCFAGTPRQLNYEPVYVKKKGQL